MALGVLVATLALPLVLYVLARLPWSRRDVDDISQEP